jgi:hypothetical protein
VLPFVKLYLAAEICGIDIRQTTLTEPDLVVFSEPNSRLFRPLGHIEPDGSRPTIDQYLPDGGGAVPLFVAMRSGKGRVVAAGTWKLCTADYGLGWLSTPGATLSQ